ncbi:MAG: hypothetical protein BMS9Abin12_1816 [Acidimicrobiia bacterium]|nr:MAG: hypothetical protein BMS9Abin12_1816 [Acidimicrobiia bacterium]
MSSLQRGDEMGLREDEAPGGNRLIGGGPCDIGRLRWSTLLTLKYGDLPIP